MASNSSINQTTYDVFVTFRGEDTGHSFTDHLYTALKQAAIHAFRDDVDIEPGQPLIDVMVKAIQNSQAFIVILSENYAKSTWCLDELSLILEQKKKGDHFVLPVFYKVHPSDVRNHRRSFAIEVNEGSKWTKENVNRWKLALRDVTDLAGEVSSGSEAELISKIVDKVYNKLDRKLLSTPAHLTGMESRAKDIDCWLKDEHSNNNVVAICGLGGSGKTTLARHVYNSNIHNFESSCFLEEIGKHFKETYGLLELQKQLLTHILGGKGKKIYSVAEGTYKINQALQRKKVLIVLDGIDEHDEVDALLGAGMFIHTKSKIIITTRLFDMHLRLESLYWRCRVNVLKLLNDEESLELFCWHAFRCKHPPEDFRDLAVSLVQYCGGNPLAVKDLGSSLYVSADDRRKRNSIIEIWKSRLNSLSLSKGDLDRKIRQKLEEVEENMKVPLAVIQRATHDFDEDNIIGSGGYGAVYEADLNDFNNNGCCLAKRMKTKDELTSNHCTTVAIKRIFSTEDGQGKEGFLAELDVLSRCEHPNIVSLLGCCFEGGEMLLVYEHVSNGSLDDYLGSVDKRVNLTWTQRLKMCIGIAEGLSYLHTNMEEKRRIIHRDIKSANILLGENLNAKIADFGFSKFFPVNHQASTIVTDKVAGTYVYLDPVYGRTGSLKRASDIYSFGVVLFELFSGRLAYDSVYIKEKKRGLAPIAKRHFERRTLIKEMLDPKIMDDEAYELGLTLKIRPGHDSLDAFSKVAFQCLAKTQAERPPIKDVILELNKALDFQEKRKKTFRYSLEDINVGVDNFSDDNCIMRGENATLYKGKVQCNDRYEEVIVKRFTGQEDGFLKEFEVLFKYRQENIIGLVGYCKEMDEKIIVYEHASKGSLDRYLKDTDLSWTKRLKICIDIANGLKFLHGGDVGQDVLIHRDMKSSNILVTEDWKAKICGFEFCLTYPTSQETEYTISDVVGSRGYCDPLYWETKTLNKESDIYSFGVILFEILCGRLACPNDSSDDSEFLDVLAKHHGQVERLDDIVFEGIKKQITVKSFATFQSIALQCLHEERKERPAAGDVVVRLEKALEYQEAYDKQKDKLHKTYKQILEQFSKTHENYSTMQKKDIYNILSKGILLEDDKLISQDLEQSNNDNYQSIITDGME